MKTLDLKKEFEATFLDGDKINDCGGALIDAKDAWSWFEKVLIEQVKQDHQEITDHLTNWMLSLRDRGLLTQGHKSVFEMILKYITYLPQSK